MNNYFEIDEFQLIDLKNNFNKEIYDKWITYLEYITKNDNHPLIKNYIDLHLSLKDHLCFNVILDSKDNIIAFSGLWNPNIYPLNTARILNKLYVDKNYRMQQLISNKSKKHFNRMIASKLMLPYQINHAKKIGLDSVFWSMEGQARRRQVEMLINSQNEILEDCQFKILENMYNTCRLMNNEINNHHSCWQHIALMKFNDNAIFSLPQLSGNEEIING